MDNLDFNKIFFIKNEDTAFQIAIMLACHYEIDRTVQETLFFANKDIVKNKVNYLTYTEMFNELLHYTKQWINDLDMIKDESDWEFHRSKLLTRYEMIKRVDAAEVVDYLMDNYKHAAQVIRSTNITWNNIVFLVENDKRHKQSIFNISFSEDKSWQLWDILKKYKTGDLENLSVEQDHIKAFSKMIKKRQESEFFRRQQSLLTSEQMQYVEKVKEDLKTITFKADVESGLKDKITTTLRKKFKL